MHEHQDALEEDSAGAAGVLLKRKRWRSSAGPTMVGRSRSAGGGAAQVHCWRGATALHPQRKRRRSAGVTGGETQVHQGAHLKRRRSAGGMQDGG